MWESNPLKTPLIQFLMTDSDCPLRKLQGSGISSPQLFFLVEISDEEETPVGSGENISPLSDLISDDRSEFSSQKASRFRYRQSVTRFPRWDRKRRMMTAGELERKQNKLSVRSEQALRAVFASGHLPQSDYDFFVCWFLSPQEELGHDFACNQNRIITRNSNISSEIC